MPGIRISILGGNFDSSLFLWRGGGAGEVVPYHGEGLGVRYRFGGGGGGGGGELNLPPLD